MHEKGLEGGREEIEIPLQFRAMFLDTNVKLNQFKLPSVKKFYFKDLSYVF